MCSILIAGGGIAGLAIALELVRHGADVTVIESGLVMQQASWAAAGMLAAEDPGNPPELLSLSREAAARYTGFLQRVEALSGLRVPFRTHQTLQIDESDDNTPADNHAGLSCRSRRLAERSIDPRDLCVALPAAARTAGVKIHEQTSLVSLAPRQARTTRGIFRADTIVLCTGAWTSTLLKVPLGAPRKGQMIAVRQQPSAPVLDVVIRAHDIYLVPRGDGRVIIGATVEDAGFDRTIHPDSSQALLRRAAELWPPILMSSIEEAWTGLRPGSPDDLPLIGYLPEQDVWIAGGLYRNGILLAPAIGCVLAAQILPGIADPLPVDLTPFLPSRFLHPTAVEFTTTRPMRTNHP